MDLEILFYCVPLFPIFIRGIFALQLKNQLNEILSEEELDKENIRNLILALEGFSFTALLAFVLLEPNIKQNLTFPIYFIFISFMFYMVALNLQGYKLTRWQDIISDTLMETASMCLILTVVSLIFISGLNVLFIYLLSIIGIGAWITDFLIRLKIQFNYINERERNE